MSKEVYSPAHADDFKPTGTYAPMTEDDAGYEAQPKPRMHNIRSIAAITAGLMGGVAVLAAAAAYGDAAEKTAPERPTFDKIAAEFKSPAQK